VAGVLGAALLALGPAACSEAPERTAGGCRVTLRDPTLSDEGRVIADTEWACARPADQIYGEATLWYCPEPRSESPTEWAQHGCQVRATVGINDRPLPEGAASGSRLTDEGTAAIDPDGVWAVVATWGSVAPAEAPHDREGSGPVRSNWVPLNPTTVTPITATPSA
jgi:hypothetical protein